MSPAALRPTSHVTASFLLTGSARGAHEPTAASQQLQEHRSRPPPGSSAVLRSRPPHATCMHPTLGVLYRNLGPWRKAHRSSEQNYQALPSRCRSGASHIASPEAFSTEVLLPQDRGELISLHGDSGSTAFRYSPPQKGQDSFSGSRTGCASPADCQPSTDRFSRLPKRPEAAQPCFLVVLGTRLSRGAS